MGLFIGAEGGYYISGRIIGVISLALLTYMRYPIRCIKSARYWLFLKNNIPRETCLILDNAGSAPVNWGLGKLSIEIFIRALHIQLRDPLCVPM